MPRVLLPLVKDFEESEAVATIDILRRAGVEVVTAGDGALTVEGAHGITLGADIRWEDRDAHGRFDALVLPGGAGTPRLNGLDGLHAMARTMADDGRLVAAICAAPTVLAKAGIMEGRRATCYPACTADMGGAQLTEEAVVIDRNVITSRGVGTAVDFGLAVAGALMGEAVAEKVATSIVHFRR